MNARAAMTPGDFDYIRDLLREQSAVTLDAGKEYLVESRLAPLAHDEGFSSYQQMVSSLRAGSFRDLHRKVVETMTNNETTFLRDARVFSMIATSILPALVARRAASRTLNIWCAACSTGQEPYSVAMVLRDQLPSCDQWNIRIIASDLSRNVLARANAGCYSKIEINRGLPAHMLVKHFVQQGATWQVRPEIRRMVEFREINLIQSWFDLPQMDFILMRNVLIYFDGATKKTILQRAGRLLDPDGYLLLGGAETTMNLTEAFEPVTRDGSVCFRPRQAATRPCMDAGPNLLPMFPE